MYFVTPFSMINDFDIKGDLGDIDPFKKEDGEEVSLSTDPTPGSLWR